MRVSPKFCADVRRLATTVLNEAANPNAKKRDIRPQINALRNSYFDMMTVLIHRLKTELDLSAVRLLELAAIKQALTISKSLLDEQIDALKAKASGKKAGSSTNSLNDHQKLFWLQKNYDGLLLKINSQIFLQIERIELRKLIDLREQYMPQSSALSRSVLTNPVLFTSQPNDSNFLIERFRLWGGDSEDAGFNELNREYESLFSEPTSEAASFPLFKENVEGTPELYDDLGGLFQTQKFMGLAIDQKAQLSEEFGPLDSVQAIEQDYDFGSFAQRLAEARKEQGLRAWWSHRRHLKHKKKQLQTFAKNLDKRGILALLVASKEVKKLWTDSIAEQIDAKILCHYICGNIDTKRLQARTIEGRTFSAGTIKQFDAIAKKVKVETKKHREECAFQIIKDIARYRTQLKYYRLAHRAFNRINLLKADNEIALSKQAGTLYKLFTASEKEDDEDRIIHHSVIKADVRGSTTVTEELQSRSLNPASFFSLRFFNPINELLATYGAQKVFIEGDAVILSFLEYEKTPQQWYSVARACGLAKSMLNIVKSNNLYSEKMELPRLELGIGLCYSDKPPYYLYDGDTPITISSAIGNADRLSSCTWKLRNVCKPAPFNVQVFNLHDDEHEHGEKGQTKLRYNVNGILLDNAGFEKLQQEVALKELDIRINGQAVKLHVGRYPDLRGKMHDIVIREGKVGLWKDNAAVDDYSSGESFYECVTNRKLIAQVVKSLT